jgi:hypothetical protein
MGKRTSFLGFLTVIVLISLLALACSKKQDTDTPPPTPDSTDTSEYNEPNTLVQQQPPLVETITAQPEADSNQPELPEIETYNQAPAGLISAIAYSDRPSVLIGEELLSEGDTLRGVKVIKISEGLVEFEKNGSRWIQRAGDPPPAYWSEPNQ